MTKYNFGEKAEEFHVKKSKNLPVWQSPKYKQSKEKAIELIKVNKYDLDESDFWILMNATKSDKMMYTGLIISHNGCLKINSKLPEKDKFKPNSVNIIKDIGEKEKVMNYVNNEQGIYEFGEISPKNCMNDYPYAMVLKRLMDRVILKSSKIGFYGIYSESESDDFKKSADDSSKSQLEKLADSFNEDVEEKRTAHNKKQYNELKTEINAANDLKELEQIFLDSRKTFNQLRRYAKDYYDDLVSLSGKLKKDFQEEPFTNEEIKEIEEMESEILYKGHIKLIEEAKNISNL